MVQARQSANTPWLTRSLQGRLLIASIFCLPLFIGASGVLLDRAFQENLRGAEAAQLKTQLYILLGAAEWQDDTLTLPEELSDPRFSSVTSGLYGQVTRSNQILWQSKSAQLLDTALPIIDLPHAAGQEQFDVAAVLFRLSYDLIWEDDHGVEQPLRFQIFHRQDQFMSGLKKYRQQLWYSLTPLAIGLLLIQLMIMRWGLQPLSLLAQDIKALPHRQDHQLTGDYPTEIASVTDSLNQVLDSEQRQRQRYQNTLGDLAHSLKTPLAIIQGEDIGKSPVITEQLERMNNIIRHQLQRAVIQGQHQLRKQEPIRPVIERLSHAMDKVYRDKNLHIDIQMPQDLSCTVETPDLFELFGNIIENACKYGQKNIRIDGTTINHTVQISIADDGNGITTDNKTNVLRRGARIDTVQPGQGLGLSISTDIISAYDGSLDIFKDTSLGGACFVVTLPC